MVRIELSKTTPLKGNPLHNLVEFVVLKTTLEDKLIISLDALFMLDIILKL